ncbi:MAG: cytochrome c [Pseudohongiellaceae bacterium]|nr:cytochrome c [Pseudohongiellaceae bacterium]
MKSKLILVLSTVLLIGAFLLFRSPSVPSVVIPNSEQALERGKYLVAAGGCVSCHESPEMGGVLSGGMALESQFGTFFVPNITPDSVSGIGGWSGEDFIRAIKHGRSPSGSFYYPAFPYQAYRGMTDDDVLDIASYLLSLEPIEVERSNHQLPWWLQRPAMAFWNLLARWSSQPVEVDISAMDDEQAALIARGEYLARHLGHCGECHTPRNGVGILRHDLDFAGSEMLEGHVEAINPEALQGWSREDFDLFLLIGLKPNGDYVGGKMEPVIEHNTSRLNDYDRKALASFFTR